MSINFGIGFSNSSNVKQAVREAGARAKSLLGQDRIDLSIVMATDHYDPEEFLPELKSLLEGSKIIGGSTAGIILSDTIETRGISILTIQSDDVQFGISASPDITADTIKNAGVQLAQRCLADFGSGPRNTFFCLTDGLIENNSLLLQGIQSIVGNIFPIVGGGTSDDFKFKPSLQIFGTQALSSSAVGLIMGGHMTVSVAARHGWRPLGKPRIVTKSKGNVIHSINNKPAAAIFEEYFSPDVFQKLGSHFGQTALLYPLGIYVQRSNEYLIRNVTHFYPDGDILCQGDVPEGEEIHVMIGNKESCKDAVRQAAGEVQSGLLGKKPKLVIVIESMARLKLFRRSAYEEIRHIQEFLGQDVPVWGFYSHGEICPLESADKVKKPYFQNESIVIMAMA